MTRKLKPVDIELSGEVQEAVLSLPVKEDDGSISTVGDLIQRAADAIEKANKAIEGNALIQLTAEHLMKKEKRRGNPSILVDLHGRAVLRITYGDDDAGEPVQAIARKSKLPTLDKLRERAKDLGVDISDLGRKKKKIIARLDEAEKKADPEPPSRLRDEVSESSLSRHSVPSPGR